MSGRRKALWDKVIARVVTEPAPRRDQGRCWIWQGPTAGTKGRGHSYPRMNVDGATMAVHRVMWALENGPIPPRKQIDHKCKNRRCVNPDHLEMVTHRQNRRRRDQ